MLDAEDKKVLRVIELLQKIQDSDVWVEVPAKGKFRFLYLETNNGYRSRLDQYKKIPRQLHIAPSHEDRNEGMKMLIKYTKTGIVLPHLRLMGTKSRMTKFIAKMTKALHDARTDPSITNNPVLAARYGNVDAFSNPSRESYTQLLEQIPFIAAFGYTDMLRFLKSQKIERSDFAALSQAISAGQTATALWLMETEDPEVMRGNAERFLHESVIQGRAEIVEYILKKYGKLIDDRPYILDELLKKASWYGQSGVAFVIAREKCRREQGNDQIQCILGDMQTITRRADKETTRLRKEMWRM